MSHYFKCFINWSSIKS